MPGPVVAIVGAGQAGFQAASSLRQERFAGRVVLIGDEPGLPYQRPPLSKAISPAKAASTNCGCGPRRFTKSRRSNSSPAKTVTAIDRPRRCLRLASGGEIECDHVVLATGARCRPLPVPGAELDGVLPLRTLADADILRERLARRAT